MWSASNYIVSRTWSKTAVRWSLWQLIKGSFYVFFLSQTLCLVWLITLQDAHNMTYCVMGGKQRAFQTVSSESSTTSKTPEGAVITFEEGSNPFGQPYSLSVMWYQWNVWLHDLHSLCVCILCCTGASWFPGVQVESLAKQYKYRRQILII